MYDIRWKFLFTNPTRSNAVYQLEVRPGIFVIIEPEVTEATEEFITRKPRNSIAIDGRVLAPPTALDGYDIFDHHVGVPRLQTLSTTAQVYRGIRFQNLLARYAVDGKVHMRIYLNVPDQDSTAAATLLVDHELTQTEDKETARRLKEFVDEVDILDSTAGMCAGDMSREDIEAHNWIFNPCFTRAPKDAFLEVRENIQCHLRRQGGHIPYNDAFARVEAHDGWAMVREFGRNARLAYRKEGITAFVSFKERPTGDGYNYVIGLSSEGENPDINLPHLYRHLNRHYGISEDDPDRFAGGTTIGGSPRKKGCPDMPNQFAKVFNAGIDKWKNERRRTTLQVVDGFKTGT